jgi:hypothetical protein
MTPSELLSQVTDPIEIRGYLDWHKKQGLDVVLMMASSDSHVRARLTGCEADGTGLIAVCTGVSGAEQSYSKAYSMVGTTAKGATFLASGEIKRVSGTADCFKLSFPDRIDISQSRDSYRCPAPASTFLHFSSSETHQNELVCKVHNLSLGGLAVEWGGADNRTAPQPGTFSDHAILVASDSSFVLGKLRIAHVTHRQRCMVVGLKFERGAPRQYGSLVLNAQRSNYLI